MNKRYVFIATIIGMVVLTITAGFVAVIEKKETVNPIYDKGFAVVELFTSEGCSSCPSADETIARLVAKNTGNVYVLTYHVDYWDRLGWKDPFSKASYTQRQNQYASVFDLNSIYTPQVIINGSSQFVGSDENKLMNTIEKDLQKEPNQHIVINLKRSENTLTVNYEIDDMNAVLLNLALVQPEATTSVKRGENSGRTLRHVNIVRDLKTIEAKGKGSVTMNISEDLNNIPLQIIAYTQARKNFQILGAVQKPL